jgi:hypothetical protein
MGGVMSPGKLHGEAQAVPASSSEDYLTMLGLLLDFGGEPHSVKKQIVPHCWKTGIGIAASAHLAAITPHCPYIEFLPANLCDSLLRKELVADELKIVSGQIPLPRKPGLGGRLCGSSRLRREP